jgi:hypothetical protein
MRNGHNGQVAATHLRTSPGWYPTQSRHLARIARITPNGSTATAPPIRGRDLAAITSDKLALVLGVWRALEQSVACLDVA